MIAKSEAYNKVSLHIDDDSVAPQLVEGDELCALCHNILVCNEQNQSDYLC